MHAHDVCGYQRYFAANLNPQNLSLTENSVTSLRLLVAQTFPKLEKSSKASGPSFSIFFKTVEHTVVYFCIRWLIHNLVTSIEWRNGAGHEKPSLRWQTGNVGPYVSIRFGPQQRPWWRLKAIFVPFNTRARATFAWYRGKTHRLSPPSIFPISAGSGTFSFELAIIMVFITSGFHHGSSGSESAPAPTLV